MEKEAFMLINDKVVLAVVDVVKGMDNEAVKAFVEAVEALDEKKNAGKNRRVNTIPAILAMLGKCTAPTTVKGLYEAHNAEMQELGYTSVQALNYLFCHELKGDPRIVRDIDIDTKCIIYSLA